MRITGTTTVGLACAMLNCASQAPPEGGGSVIPLREQLEIRPRTPEVLLDQDLPVRLLSRDEFYRIMPPIQWVSSQPDVITVRGMGEEASLRGVRVGSAIVSATDANGATATVRVRVRISGMRSGTDHVAHQGSDRETGIVADSVAQ